MGMQMGVRGGEKVFFFRVVVVGVGFWFGCGLGGGDGRRSRKN